MVSLSRPYPFKFFKGCLPQNLLRTLLNILSQMKFATIIITVWVYNNNFSPVHPHFLEGLIYKDLLDLALVAKNLS